MPNYCENSLTASHPDVRMMILFIQDHQGEWVDGVGESGPGLNPDRKVIRVPT